MALMLNISQTDVGASFNSAYARVAQALVSNDFHGPPTVEAIVEFYASEQARLTRAIPVHRMNFAMEMPQGDFMTGVYATLKSMDEFAGAEDC